MSRAQQRIKRKVKRQRQTAERVALVAKINGVVEPMGCRLIALGPSAVGVQGDARTYGIAIVVRFPQDVSTYRIGEISNEVTNRVREVTRVLMEI